MSKSSSVTIRDGLMYWRYTQQIFWPHPYFYRSGGTMPHGTNLLVWEVTLDQSIWDEALALVQKHDVFWALSLPADADDAFCNRLLQYQTSSGAAVAQLPNLVLVELCRDLSLFDEESLRRHLHEIRPFFEHTFGRQVSFCYFPEHGPVPEFLEYELRKFGFCKILSPGYAAMPVSSEVFHDLSGQTVDLTPRTDGGAVTFSNCGHLHVRGAGTLGAIKLEHCCDVTLEGLKLHTHDESPLSVVDCAQIQVMHCLLETGGNDPLSICCTADFSMRNCILFAAGAGVFYDRNNRGTFRFEHVELHGGSPDALASGRGGDFRCEFHDLLWFPQPGAVTICSVADAVYRNITVIAPDCGRGELNFQIDALGLTAPPCPATADITMENIRLFGDIHGIRLIGFEYNPSRGIGGITVRNLTITDGGGVTRMLRDMVKKCVSMGEDYYEFDVMTLWETQQ